MFKNLAGYNVLESNIILFVSLFLIRGIFYFIIYMDCGLLPRNVKYYMFNLYWQQTTSHICYKIEDASN